MDKDFIITHYNDGIILQNPKIFKKHNEEFYDIETFQTVKDLLELPLNVIFLSQNSNIKEINETNALTLGFDSIQKALGKTVQSTYNNETAKFSLNHDREVMKNKKRITKEEYCKRIDGISFYTITAKIPWYNHAGELVGVIGGSVPLGLRETHNIEDSLQALLELSKFNNHFRNINSFLPGRMVNGHYLSKREAECVYYLVRGQTAKMIARTLNLSPRTVEDYLTSAKGKLDVNNKPALIDVALKSWLGKVKADASKFF